MKWTGDQLSIGFGKPTIRAIALIGLVALAAVAGAGKALVRFNAPAEGVGDVAVEATAMAPEGEPVAASVPLEVVEEPAWDLPNLDHPRVDYWVGRFTTDKREQFSGFLRRSGRYIPMISEKLEERGMPRDLVYLAMIESGFKPKAYSRADASGLWQFIAETGRRYGLDINRAVDERNDPIKATEAALDYLTYLHRRFGSWYLAAAGYNTGENRVGRIMQQMTGSERGNEYSYYEIWNRLPRETRDYVPLMVAAARISKEPEKYGFGDVAIAEGMEYDEVVVPAGTALSAVAEAAGTSVSEIRLLNPHFKLNRTRNDMASPVRLPSGSETSFVANWPQGENSRQVAQAEAHADTRSHRVRRGDNLTRIARRYGVTIAQLRRANDLRGDLIKAGATLLIPS